jgi:N-acetylated-alpha-linked acidic dipeptidase
MMRVAPVLCLCALATVSASPSAAQSIRGFPDAMLEAQRSREEIARAVPRRDTLRARMRLLSEDPHHAGFEGSRRVADLILERFRSFGLDAEIERFEALMPVPVSRSVEMVAPERFVARIEEPEIPEDKDSGDSGGLPSYNAYSPDGDVTGDLVYVNYGTPEDYAVLDSLGITVEGRIVIARYGRSWRGIKPKVAAEHGAIATLIYSDPRDDGFFVSDVYPEGPMRSELGVQRGSVMDMPRYPGDPLSPGWTSEAGARKLALDDVITFSPIPVFPLSYGDALPLLRNLGGDVVPDAWKGALPITYHTGPGPARVRIALEFDWQTRPVWNVIARIQGERWPGQAILFGNHHDAWVNGAEDPISGMVAVEEMARSLGVLLETGWRPDRTIVIAAWDAEEWGLIGSTEWVEKHLPELDEGGVVYINSDTNNRGWLNPSGSHSLELFVEQLARDIRDPDSGNSVLEARLERQRSTNPSDPDTTFSIGALGSGSDYTAFLDHAGMAALHVAYGGGAQAGIYHSKYDTFDHYTRFMDTTFAYGVAEAQTLATAALRLADSPVLPFEFTRVATTYRGYAEEIENGAAQNPLLESLDLTAVHLALDQLDEAAAAWESAYAGVRSITENDVAQRPEAFAELNRLLYTTERRLSDPAGLPEREWFRHLIYAPGFYTGYGVKTMPGIREVVEDVPDLAVARTQAARVAAAVEAYAAQVRMAAELLDRM